MSHDTYEGQRTYKTDDFEQQLRTTLHTKATSYYPDGTKPPTWPLTTTRGTTTVTQSNTIASTSLDEVGHREPRKRKYLALAASVAAIAVAGGLSIKHFGGNDDLRVAQEPTATSDAAGKSTGKTGARTTSTRDPESSDGSVYVKPDENHVSRIADPNGLPAHMKRTHNGPAKFKNFPFFCPGGSGGQDGDGDAYIQTSTAVNPIEYCKSKGLLGTVNPKLAVIRHRFGSIFISDARPRASETPFPSGEAATAAMRKYAVPSGVTYTGVDYEVQYARLRTHLKKGGTCPVFDEYVSQTETLIKKVTGGSWVVKIAPVGAQEQFPESCHNRRDNLATRTVYLTEYTRAAGSPQPKHDSGGKYDNHIKTIMDSVNTKCLSLKDAVDTANTAARKSNPTVPFGPAVSLAVNAGGSCARLYEYPSGGVQFIAFGS